MKKLVQLIRDEPNDVVKMLIANMGMKPTTTEAIILGYIVAPSISPEQILLMIKLGLISTRQPKLLAQVPEGLQALLAQVLCREFLHALDRMDGEVLQSWGNFVSAMRQKGMRPGSSLFPDRDKIRSALLFAKNAGAVLTLKKFKETLRYKGEDSNLRKLAADVGYCFAPGRRGAPRKAGIKGT